MSGPIQSDRLGGTGFNPLPGEGAAEAGKTAETGKVSSGVLTNAEGVTVSRDGAAVAQGAAGQAHRLDAPSQGLTPNNFSTAQGDIKDLLSDFLAPDQRQAKPKRNPLVALAALSGELSADELETESAGGFQKRLDKNQDKSQVRSALGQQSENEKSDRSERNQTAAQKGSESTEKSALSSQRGAEQNPEEREFDSAGNVQQRADSRQDKSQLRSAAGAVDSGSAEETEGFAEANAADPGNKKKAKKNPLAATPAAVGIPTEEMEAESALGSQRRLETRSDKAQLRKAATGEKSEEEINAARASALSELPDISDLDISSEEAYVDIYNVMAIMHKMANSNRRMAKESRAVSYDAAKNEILNQAKEMRSGAMKRFIGAVIQNTAQIASAGASLGAMKGADASTAQIASARAGAVGSAITGAGGLAAAAFNLEASKHDAKVKEHEAFQKTYENSAQSDSEFMNAMQDMIRNVQSSMAEIIRAKHETEKSIIRS